MATINVRVDEHILEALDELAAGENITRSDYVRNLVLEAVVPMRESRSGDQQGPESMTALERKTLSMLHRILARVLPEGSNDSDGDRDYQIARARALEEGFTSAYDEEFYGFSTELPKRDSRRVVDILEFFSVAKTSMTRLADAADPVSPGVAERLKYAGFDYNDNREGHLASYVEYLLSQNRWTDLADDVADADGGNSHSLTLPVYSRMLAEYRRIMDARRKPIMSPSDYRLSRDELTAIAAAASRPAPR